MCRVSQRSIETACKQTRYMAQHGAVRPTTDGVLKVSVKLKHRVVVHTITPEKLKAAYKYAHENVLGH